MELSECYRALHKMQNVGPMTVKKLLDYNIDLCSLFNKSYEQLLDLGLPAKLANQICSFDFNLLKLEDQWKKQEYNHLLTWDDVAYPSLLKQIADPPLVLYAKGELSLLNLPMVAIIGSRSASATGLEIAHNFAYELAKQKLVIVSGLAYGIDAKAHMASLQAKGKTIAVMGTGIDVIYPQSHKSLALDIINNGLLLSEFALGTGPNPRHFPRRNRIISGLTLATVVIEAALKSGSLITARLALEQNREVLAVPGSIYNSKAQGCHELIKQGATLVTEPKDVLMALNLDLITAPSNNAMVIEPQGLLNYIGFELTTVDQITKRSGLMLDNTLCELANLEILGYIRSVAGGYIRCKL